MNPAHTSKNACRFSKPFYTTQQSNSQMSNYSSAPQQFFRPVRPNERFLRPSSNFWNPNMFHQMYSTPYSLILYIIRGLPGSGKSTLARNLCSNYGVILSTDDYFNTSCGYIFDPTALPDAHEWNKNRAISNFQRRVSPIVIDNTNLAQWEMKPYMDMAVDYGYEIEIVEPETWWKYDANELARRNVHNVRKDKIQNMFSRFEKNVTVESVLGKQMYARYQQQLNRFCAHPNANRRPHSSQLRDGGGSQRGGQQRNLFQHPGNGNDVRPSTAYNSSRGSNRGARRHTATSQRPSPAYSSSNASDSEQLDDVINAIRGLNMSSQQRTVTANQNGDRSTSNPNRQSSSRRRPRRGR